MFFKFSLAGTLLVTLLLAGNLAFSADYKGLGEGSVSPEIVAKHRAAPLEPELSRRLQSMIDIRSPGLGRITSDGKTLFFGWSITGTYQVWKVTGPQKFPTQMTGGEDRTRLIDITPDNKYLVITRDRKGEENPGLYLQPAQGGALIEIQHKPKVQTFPAYLSSNSRYIYYRANDLKPDSYAIYKYDIVNKTKELIFDQPGVWEIADVLKDRHFLLQKATGSITSEYYTYDIEKKSLEPVIGQNETEQYEVAFLDSPKTFLVLTPKFGEFKRLYHLVKKEMKPITPDIKMDVDSFQIDFNRTRILYSTNDQGYFKAHGMSAKTFKEITLPKFKDALQVHLGATSRNGHFTTFAIETSKSPQLNFVYDWRTHKLSQWVLPSSPEIDTSKAVVPVLESYPARDGTKIPMFVTRPPQCAKRTCPVIVEFHGGPEGQSLPGFNLFGQFLVENGFVLAEPNVRGSEGYGKSWLGADDGAKRLNVISDIEDAATFIRAKWSFDGKVPKIGIMGGSYGGYSTLMGMSKFAGAYDAGVAIVGMSNLITFLMNTAPYRRMLRISEYGDPEKDKEALQKLSPMTYLDQIKSPLLLIQGLNDPRVPAGEALQIYTELEKKKIPTGLIIFADEGHGASKRENQVLQMGHTFLFLKKHLQD